MTISRFCARLGLAAGLLRPLWRWAVVLGFVALVTEVGAPPWEHASAQVSPMATCNPNTNPDCQGGGGGCRSQPCTCSTGRTVGILRNCATCGYNAVMDLWLYSGTWLVTKECCFQSCPCPQVQCLEARACGYCQ